MIPNPRAEVRKVVVVHCSELSLTSGWRHRFCKDGFLLVILAVLLLSCGNTTPRGTQEASKVTTTPVSLISGTWKLTAFSGIDPAILDMTGSFVSKGNRFDLRIDANNDHVRLDGTVVKLAPHNFELSFENGNTKQILVSDDGKYLKLDVGDQEAEFTKTR